MEFSDLELTSVVTCLVNATVGVGGSELMSSEVMLGADNTLICYLMYFNITVVEMTFMTFVHARKIT